MNLSQRLCQAELDLVFQVKNENPALKDKVRTILNNVFAKAKLIQAKNSTAQNFVKIGNVKDIDELPRDLENASLFSDWLFDVSSEKSSNPRSQWHHFEKMTADDFVQSLVTGEMIVHGDPHSKTLLAFKAAKPLLQLPFLNLNTEGRALLISQLEELLKTNLSDDEMEKFSKAMENVMRDAQFGSAHNRFYRESDLMFKLFIAVSKNLSTANVGNLSAIFPVFLKRGIERSAPTGQYASELEELIIDKDEFSRRESLPLIDNQPILHHGTRIENVVSILRNGFVISTNEQGAAHNGAGLCTASQGLAMIGYGGVSFPLKIKKIDNLRVLDMRDVYSNEELLKNLREEMKAKGYSDLNFLLEEEYGIDIVIPRGDCPFEVLVLNQDILDISDNLGSYLTTMSQLVHLNINNIKNSIALYKAYCAMHVLARQLGYKVEFTVQDMQDRIINELMKYDSNIISTFIVEVIKQKETDLAKYILKMIQIDPKFITPQIVSLAISQDISILYQSILNEDYLKKNANVLLYGAITANNIKLINELLVHINDINYINHEWDTISYLYAATKYSSLEIMQELVARGADVNAGYPPPIAAATDSLDKDKINYLINSGVPINSAFEHAFETKNTKALQFLIMAFPGALEQNASTLISLAIAYKNPIWKKLILQLTQLPDFLLLTIFQQKNYDAFIALQERGLLDEQTVHKELITYINFLPKELLDFEYLSKLKNYIKVNEINESDFHEKDKYLLVVNWLKKSDKEQEVQKGKQAQGMEPKEGVKETSHLAKAKKIISAYEQKSKQNVIQGKDKTKPDTRIPPKSKL